MSSLPDDVNKDGDKNDGNVSANVSEKDEQERRAALIMQLHLLGQIASTETALYHQMAAAKYGLGITDMKALSVLTQEGSLTAGQLGKRLSLTTGAVTNLIDRLQRHQMVERVFDPTDRRKVIVVVNQETLAAGENIYLSMGAAFSALYATYTTEQLEFLVQYSQASVQLTREETAKLVAHPEIPLP